MTAGKPLDAAYRSENVDLVTAGCCNLARHISNSAGYGVPVVVAINRFAADTEAELAAVRQAALNAGATSFRPRTSGLHLGPCRMCTRFGTYSGRAGRTAAGRPGCRMCLLPPLPATAGVSISKLGAFDDRLPHEVDLLKNPAAMAAHIMRAISGRRGGRGGVGAPCLWRQGRAGPGQGRHPGRPAAQRLQVPGCCGASMHGSL